MTTATDLALLRLVALRVAGPPPADAAAAVRLLTCVQAQELPGAVTSVALRTAQRTRAGVEAALECGAVVRSWPMRSTLHLLPAEDLPWLLALCGPRVLAGAARRRAVLGVTDADTERARDLVTAALTGGRRRGRRDLLAAVADGGVATTGQRGYHLLWYLAQTGTLCLGPMADGEQQFVLLDEWVPAPRRLDRDAALAELALRYLRGHGPATVADLARWSGLTVTDVRAGVAAVRDQLTAVEVDGREHLMAPETADLLAACRGQAAGLFLLPGFDELVLGYADRSCTVPPQFADRIVPGGNGVFRPTVVHGGRVLGTWAWQGPRSGREGADRTVAATPFTAFPDDVAAAIPAAAAALP
ncbi:winged helix DNA-binding domain-containing protein [Geodermatophilus sp. DSM 44513]|uniref:winged helix DNA-binding domain-containing protein n=1 Tax=Geodermatophilus sp. DSM 44513 TaxID=1528104 RepID=UPI00127D0FFB|nr:winged helix DNA-binding domain-containing protein [Geodermatophilus sp. DSM 44513]WNV76737.1 winged helix DNA-binding domain-containing protein [Geodermatophilus sp. DSM 44513]